VLTCKSKAPISRWFSREVNGFVIRYVKMWDNVGFMSAMGWYDHQDTEDLIYKANLITRCLLDSYIPPRTRVS